LLRLLDTFFKYLLQTDSQLYVNDYEHADNMSP